MEERFNTLYDYATVVGNTWLANQIKLLKTETEIELIDCEIETINRVSEEFSLTIKK